MLLNDDEHEQVLNLTGEQVQRLDDATVKMRMDSNRYIYNGRTRAGDETGSQMQILLYGKNMTTGNEDSPPEFENLVENRSFRYAFAI